MNDDILDPALARIVERVRSAIADGTPLCLRGGGSKGFYGGVPRGEPLDLRDLRGISSYEPSELVVTARAGTPLAELEAVLAEKGQCLPFEPPHFTGEGTAGSPAAGTVGGMVAAGLAGPSRAVAGSVRDHVLGATLLNGRAEVLSFGGQVMKNVAGYDISRLLAGSMGVLGVICEVSLKVLPRPRASCTLRFEMSQAEAIQRCNEWAGQPLPLNASAWVAGRLNLRLAGAVAAVDAAARQLGGEALQPNESDAFWAAVRDHRHAFFTDATAPALWRLSLPQTCAAAAHGEVLSAGFVEWGGAQRWVWSGESDEALQRAAAAAGGHAVRFRSQVRATGAFTPPAEPLARIHRALKSAFDPAGVFNPGRLMPDL